MGSWLRDNVLPFLFMFCGAFAFAAGGPGSHVVSAIALGAGVLLYTIQQCRILWYESTHDLDRNDIRVDAKERERRRLPSNQYQAPVVLEQLERETNLDKGRRRLASNHHEFQVSPVLKQLRRETHEAERAECGVT